MDVPIQWTWVWTGQGCYQNILPKKFLGHLHFWDTDSENIFDLQQPVQYYLKWTLNYSAAAIAAHAAFRKQSTRRQVALVQTLLKWYTEEILHYVSYHTLLSYEDSMYS